MSKDDSRLTLSQVAGPLTDLLQKLDGPKGEETLARLKLMLRGEFLGWDCVPRLDASYILEFGGLMPSQISNELTSMSIHSVGLGGYGDMLAVTERTKRAQKVELVFIEPEQVGLESSSSPLSALHGRARLLNMAVPPSDAVFMFACMCVKLSEPVIFPDIKIWGWGNRASALVIHENRRTEIRWLPVSPFSRISKAKYALMRIPQE